MTQKWWSTTENSKVRTQNWGLINLGRIIEVAHLELTKARHANRVIIVFKNNRKKNPFSFLSGFLKEKNFANESDF